MISWIILPSEKAAERIRRTSFSQSNQSVWLGETFFSLQHFLNKLSGSHTNLLKKSLQKHLLAHCLKQHPLKYFEKQRHLGYLTTIFMTAIHRLKQADLKPDGLKERLKESGSLKEYDLLITYQRYEELKTKLGCIDSEDQYASAVANLNNPENPLKMITSITFQDFDEEPDGLKKLLHNIAQNYPQIHIDFQKIPTQEAPRPSNNPQPTPVQLFSLPTPHQESHWFVRQLEKIASDTTKTNDIGILMSGPAGYYEFVWKLLQQMQLTEGPYPFSSWHERPEGRSVLEEAAQLNLEKATLTEYLSELVQKIPVENPLFEFLESFYFQEHILSLGHLSHSEWLLWLHEALEEKPKRSVPESLQGIQWLLFGERDYPHLEYLWVPNLTEGAFPLQAPQVFFQEMKDRGRPEWKPICAAFPDPQKSFERQYKMFHHTLSHTHKTTWLTFPRMDSLGGDQSPSPFTWDFGEPQNVETKSPSFFGNNEEKIRIDKKWKIERERLDNHLETKAFHTELGTIPLPPNHIFSPSQLETYAECPFKYYSRKILNIPQIKEHSPELDPDDKGTLFHNCLEALLRQEGKLYAEARNNRKKEDELYLKLKATVEKVFQESAKELCYAHPELYQRLKEKTMAQAVQLLGNELEESRKLEKPLTPTYFEWTFGPSPEEALRIEAQDKKEPIQIGGRIDRIDCDTNSKSFMVLDYKTGSISGFKDKLMEGLSLQLPIYLLAVKKLLLPDYQIVGGMLLSTRSGKKEAGLVDNQFNEQHYQLGKRSGALMDSEKLEAVIQSTVVHIQNYVAQMRKGYFSAQPKDCKVRCDYKEICRYAHKPFA